MPGLRSSSRAITDDAPSAGAHELVYVCFHTDDLPGVSSWALPPQATAEDRSYVDAS